MTRSFKMTQLALVFCTGALAACASTPTPYHARGTGSTGYYDQKLSATHFMILYTDTKNLSLDDYVKVHAAEVALAQGFPDFVVVTSGVRSSTRTSTDFRPWNEVGTSAQINSDLNQVIPRPIDQKNYTVFDAYGEIDLLSADQAKTRAGALDAKTVIATTQIARG